MQEVILIVDDEKSIVNAISGVLEDEGYQTRAAGSGEEALDYLSREIPDLVLLDIWMKGLDGLETLTRMKALAPELGVIMISGHGTIETAVRATKLGAINFIEKPISLEKLIHEVRQSLRQQALERENKELRNQISNQQNMIGSSVSISSIRKLIATAGPSNGRVLIVGESGTGKELVAREIHRASLRVQGPFVEVNCAAIPEDLIESELFGHEKGAFTNALFRKKGKFELAHAGTLFLDEVGDMSLKTQAKVLRVLEEGKIERVGGNRSISIDVRVIAASNKNLIEEIENNRFREDLYYRLNVIPITVPPLRTRANDIPDLIQHYLDFYSREYGKLRKTVSPPAMKILTEYNWPGNIRELRNEVERLVIMTMDDTIYEKDLRDSLRKSLPHESSTELKSDMKTARDCFERNLILQRLESYRWNITQTAESLGMERTNLYRKMKLLGIPIASEIT